MKSFKDSTGRAWDMAITVATVKRCRARVEIDIPGLFDDELKEFQKLMNDPIRFVELVFCIVEPEAKERQVSSEAFDEVMYGEAIEDAMNAFLAEVVDFFPDKKRRDALRRILGQMKTLQDQMQDQVMEEAESQIARVDIAGTVKTMMNSSGERLESSGLILRDSPAKN